MIGDGGARIKQIGIGARKITWKPCSIAKVMLRLWVKVKRVGRTTNAHCATWLRRQFKINAAFIFCAPEPWREDDWLLDIFTEQAGRMHCAIKSPSTPLILFHCYCASWTQGIASLKGWHLSARHDFLQGKTFCGFIWVNCWCVCCPSRKPRLMPHATHAF